MQIQKVTVSRLIPKSYLEELIQIREEMTLSYWRIGDITNAIIAYSVANKMAIERMNLYESVGSVVGKSGRSVRLYAYISSFYPPSARTQYEVLPYSHFVIACQFKGGSEWQNVLESALDYMGEFGLPPSLERLATLARGAPIINIQAPEIPPIVQPQTTTLDIQAPTEAQLIEEIRLESEIDAIIHRLPILVERLHLSSEVKYTRCAELLAQIYTLSKEVENIIYGKQIEVQSDINA